MSFFYLFLIIVITSLTLTGLFEPILKTPLIFFLDKIIFFIKLVKSSTNRKSLICKPDEHLNFLFLRQAAIVIGISLLVL